MPCDPEFFLRPGETQEARFKRVCHTLLDRDIFPGPKALNAALPNHSPHSRNLNGRECKWRAEVLLARGYVKGEPTGAHSGPWVKREAT